MFFASSTLGWLGVLPSSELVDGQLLLAEPGQGQGRCNLGSKRSLRTQMKREYDQDTDLMSIVHLISSLAPRLRLECPGS